MNREKLPEYIFNMFPLLHKKLLMRHPDSVVTRQQMNLMHKIKFHPNGTMSEYCHKTMISKPNMSKLVNGLIDEGYVVRHRDNEDRRKVTLNLSEKGNEVVAKFFRDMGKQIVDSTQALTEDEINQLVESFDTIHTLLDKLDSHEENEMEAH